MTLLLVKHPCYQLKKMYKVRTIYCDIDGCLIPLDKEEIHPKLIKYLKRINTLSEENTEFPKIGLCTGRDVQFVRTIFNNINTKITAVCENGGILYNNKSGVVLNDKIDEILLQNMQETKRKIEKYLIQKNIDYYIEPNKKTMISFRPNKKIDLIKLFNIIKQNLGGYNISLSASAVDINFMHINKYNGLKEALKIEKININSICYIGDSSSDILPIKKAGYSGVPNNALDEVKKSAKYISPHSNGKGVLDIFQNYLHIMLKP